MKNFFDKILKPTVSFIPPYQPLSSFSFVLIVSLCAGFAACGSAGDGPAGIGGDTGTLSSDKAITGFRFEAPPNPVAAMGTITGTAITVLVPTGTTVIGLVPTIDVSPGATVDPASGTAWDSAGPVTYTVTAEDGAKAFYTVTVLTELGFAGIGDYLSTITGGGTDDDPVFLPVGIDLADTGGSGWADLLDEISAAGKYVALDLSACTMSGTEFDPDITITAGKDRIVSLTLPDAAVSIKDGTISNQTFKSFTRLITVAGENITAIGEYVFADCYTLTTATFPEAITIGDEAFSNCTSLETVDFPEAVTIGGAAFYDCTSLTTAEFPLATGIGNSAFQGCTLLTTAEFPEALSIGAAAFQDCTSLAAANFPLVTSIDNDAFRDCTSLETADFPAALSIGTAAFHGCVSLDMVDFPAAVNIGNFAFEYCTSLAAVTATDFPLVTTIGGVAFQGCTSLTAVEFPEALRIDTAAFQGCTSLETANFPLVTSIGGTVFYQCRALAALNLPASPPTMETGVFNYTYNSDDPAAALTIQIASPGTVAAYRSTWSGVAATMEAGNSAYGTDHKIITLAGL